MECKTYASMWSSNIKNSCKQSDKWCTNVLWKHVLWEVESIYISEITDL